MSKKYSFVKPWSESVKPQTTVYGVRPEEDVKIRLSRVDSDLKIIAQLCEEFGLCSSSDAQGFREEMVENAMQLPYRLLHYYDFAGVSLRGLLEKRKELLNRLIYERASQQYDDTYELESYIWEEALDKIDDSGGSIRFVLSDCGDGQGFGRGLPYSISTNSGKTKIQLAEQLLPDLRADHPKHEFRASDVRVPLILSIMDLASRLNGTDMDRVRMYTLYCDLTINLRPGLQWGREYIVGLYYGKTFRLELGKYSDGMLYDDCFLIDGTRGD
jgi:hypothetical protein